MQEKTINIFERAGAFAENKDVARDMRINEISVALKEGKDIILNFEKVRGTTQSFIHALISDILRSNGMDILDRIIFKSCDDAVKGIINIVVDYMSEGLVKS
jgi:hypothetical protein